MAVTKVVLIVSHEKVSFRFQRILRCQLNRLLCVFKYHFPEMRWNPKIKSWELPFERFQAVYESCRSIFGPESVKIHSQHHTTNHSPSQPSLFD